MAFGSNISALWILNANGWMQYPTGAHFNIDTLRMEMSSFSDLVFNPVSRVKFVHTVMSGYVTGAMFIMSISARYLLRGREREVALRSFAIGSVFGTPPFWEPCNWGQFGLRSRPNSAGETGGDGRRMANRTRARAVSSDCWPQQEQERNALP